MSVKRIAIFKHDPGSQRGAALLIMLVILVVGAAAVLINSLTSSSVKTARQETTAAALAQAKEALIGYAITYGDTHTTPPEVHGYLPCPDTTSGSEGVATSPCGGTDVSVIGRLPWATLDVSPLRDGDGECLWYAVSGTYKSLPKTSLMNWDTNGQLQAFTSDGALLTQPDNQVVAVIFAPGAAQSGQDRSGTTFPVCGGNYTAANYLDNDTVHSINNANVAATGKFIQGTSGSSVNDQMLFITRQDIWNAIKKRNDFQPTSPNNVLYQMTQAAATCLAGAIPRLPNPNSPTNYGNGLVGWVPVSSSALTGCATASTWGNWWSNWSDHLFYDPTRPDVNGVQYDAAIIFANPKISLQNRITTSNPANYLEGNNLSTFMNTGSTSYQTAPISGTFNDILYCVPTSSSTAIPCP